MCTAICLVIFQLMKVCFVSCSCSWLLLTKRLLNIFSCILSLSFYPWPLWGICLSVRSVVQKGYGCFTFLLSIIPNFFLEWTNSWLHSMIVCSLSFHSLSNINYFHFLSSLPVCWMWDEFSRVLIYISLVISDLE